MALVFDSLSYSRKLREAGLDPKIAEAAADAAREFMMLELVTRNDLNTAIEGLRREIENQTLRITIRMGVMLTAGVSILAAIQRLH